MEPATDQPDDRRARRTLELVVFAALALGLAFIHGPLVSADPLLHRDDLSLVAPLERMPSLGAYFDSLFALGAAPAEVRILDLQPVRDLSLYVNVVVKRTWGLGTFHLTNVLLWALGVFLLYRLLARLTHWTLALGWVSVFAMHPALHNAVAWVSARKHLLSFDFILAATLLLVGLAGEPRARDAARVVTLYTFSLLSQPITLLWPLWAALHLWLRGGARAWRSLWLAAVCAVPMLGLGLYNYIGYSGPNSRGKLVGDVEGGLSVAVLSVGRAFANLCAPGWLATAYYPGSLINLVGLSGLVLFGLVMYRRVGRVDTARWLTLMLTAHLLLNLKQSSIFLFDSYLLLGSIGFFALLALATRDLEGPARRGLLVGLGALSVAGAWGSSVIARTWLSDAALWAHAARVEPTPNALAKHAHFLTAEGKTRDAIEVALRLREWAPEHPECGYVLANAVFSARELDARQKLALLQQSWLEDAWMHERAGLLCAQLGRFDEAAGHLLVATRTPEPFRGDFPVIAAEAVAFCEAAHRAGCEGLVQGSFDQPGFDQRAYQAHLERLRAEVRRQPR